MPASLDQQASKLPKRRAVRRSAPGAPSVKKNENILREIWPKVRRVFVNNTVYYQVDARGRGVGLRETFSTQAEAIARAQEIEHDFVTKSSAFREFSEEQRMEAQECIELLEPYGVRLRDAVAEWVEQRKQRQAAEQAMTFSSLVKSYLAHNELRMRKKQIRVSSYDELRIRAERYRRHFGDYRLPQITRAEVEQYLHNLPISSRALINERVKLSQIFNFALERNLVAANPVSGIKIEADDKEPGILTSAECRELLRVMSQPLFDQWLPFVTVSLFAGLRPGEVKQLNWREVDLDNAHIHVLPHTSKSGRHGARYVPIEPILAAWLALHRPKDGEGPLFQEGGFAYWFRKARIDAGLVPEERAKGRGNRSATGRWEDDVMRHTFASNWLHRDNNRAKLAEIMGNSADVIGRHYRKPIPRGEVEAFWALYPNRLGRRKAPTRP